MEIIEQEKVELIKIGTTELILIDYDLGKGKIIIIDDEYDINVSYFWGSMGKSTLKEFLLRIDKGYFVRTLGRGFNSNGEIDIKRTMRNVRDYIKNEICFKWYMDLDYNRDLRSELNNIQRNTWNAESFVSQMSDLKTKLDPFYCDHNWKYEAENLMSSLTCEPWHHIVYAEPRENIWLGKFYDIIQKKLKK